MEHITGTIIRAGTMDVEGEKLTGFFVETTGPDIRSLSDQGLYNAQVIVMKDRRSENRAQGPAFQREPVAVHGVGPEVKKC
jgi:hypothetical protein